MSDLIKMFYSVRGQWRWMALCFVLLAPVSSWAQITPTGTAATNTTTPADSSKLKFVNKIGHWITAYGMSGEEFVQDQRDSFKTAAFAEVYIECIIDYDTWLFNLLNRVTKLRNEEKQSPYIFFELKFLPKDGTLTSYTIPTFTLKSSNTINDLDKIAVDAHTKYLKGKTYAEPVQSIPDVEKAVKEVLKVLKEKLGNSLAPDLMVRYQNEFFWNGHEISILDTEGNSLELEAINKNIQPYSPNDIVWTNADPFGSKGVVDMTGVSSKTVSLKRKSDSLAMTVTVKRASLTDDVNEILKAAIIEVLTYKKKEALDSVAQLKKDSIDNANNAALFIAQIESENFPMINDGTSLTPMFSTPLLRSNDDEQSLINAKDKRADSFLELKKRKTIRKAIKLKINVAAFADLVVDHPQEIQTVLNALLENSGRLVAQLILGQTGEGRRDAARNIVVDFLNKNLESIVGTRFPDTLNDPPVVLPVTPIVASTTPTFRADKFLYINKYADFKGRASLETELNIYLNKLDTPLYVFINYSQDNSREGFMARSKGTKPAGLPMGARYKVYTIINIPGSLYDDGYGVGVNSDADSNAGKIVDDVEKKSRPVTAEMIEFASLAMPVLSEDGYLKTIEKIYEIYQFFNACNEEGWVSYQNEGIVPYCFWRDQEVETLLKYTSVDNAFNAGIIDGAYSEVEGIYKFPELAKKISSVPSDLIKAYTIRYLQCSPLKLLAKSEELEYVMGKLAEAEREKRLINRYINWTIEIWLDREGDKEDLIESIKECQDAIALRNNVEEIYLTVSSIKEIQKLYGQVEQKFSAYFNTLSKTDNLGRYKQGRLIVPVATTVVSLGGGAIGKLGKVRNVLKGLQELTAEKWKKVIDDLGKAIVRSASKTINNLPNTVKSIVSKFPDEGSKTKFLSLYFDDVTDVFKKAVDANPNLANAWRVIQGSSFSTNISYLEKIERNLDWAGDLSKLSAEFKKLPNDAVKAKWIEEFVKIDLREVDQIISKLRTNLDDYENITRFNEIFYRGAAKDLNAARYSEIISDLKANDVKINFSRDTKPWEGSYQLGDKGPGALRINPEADIRTFEHEYKHFLDDKAHGYPGLRHYLENLDLMFKMEQNSYGIEKQILNNDILFPEPMKIRQREAIDIFLVREKHLIYKE